MEKKKQIIILFLLIGLLVTINYPFLDSALEEVLLSEGLGNFAEVQRVVDGDTIKIENESVRLLGINTPERGEKYYSEAKDFLENLVLGKQIKLEGNQKDKYYRRLSYLFLKGENINVKIVEEGFANVYILGDEKYEKELRDAWKKCLDNGRNLCEKSVNECGNCIELKKFENQEVVFYNKCNFDCSLSKWTIKDEGRKKFIFGNFVLEGKKEVKIITSEGKDSKDELFWKDEDYVWTSGGDTLFLRDSDGKLVLWKSY